MLPNDLDFLAHREREKELWLEAERERLIILMKASAPEVKGVHGRVLGWLGGQFIEWGIKLRNDNLTQLKNLKELAENTD